MKFPGIPSVDPYWKDQLMGYQEQKQKEMAKQSIQRQPEAGECLNENLDNCMTKRTSERVSKGKGRICRKDQPLYGSPDLDMAKMIRISFFTA